MHLPRSPEAAAAGAAPCGSAAGAKRKRCRGHAQQGLGAGDVAEISGGLGWPWDPGTLGPWDGPAQETTTRTGERASLTLYDFATSFCCKLWMLFDHPNCRFTQVHAARRRWAEDKSTVKARYLLGQLSQREWAVAMEQT